MGILTKAEPKKMRIKLTQAIAGQRTKSDPKTGKPTVCGAWAHDRGSVIDWPEDEAKRFIENGIALPAEGKELQEGMIL